MKKYTAIWGTGELGRNIFYKLREKENIRCWYDDEDFHDTLYHLEKGNIREKMRKKKLLLQIPTGLKYARN